MAVLPENIRVEAERSAVLDTFLYTQYKGASDQDSLGDILINMGKLDDYKVGGKYHGEYIILQQATQKDPDLKEYQISNQSWNENFDSGTSAVVFSDPNSKDVYVAYRGTGDGEWMDNGEGMTSINTDQQKRAAVYFDQAAEKNGWDSDTSLIITGHSKGGNKAQYVTIASEHADLIDKCYNFDGQGFSPEAIQYFKELYGDDYHKGIDKMYSICGENDYVNVLGVKVIPEEHSYYIETPVDAKDFANFHDIKYMFSNGKNEEDQYTFNGLLNDVTPSQGALGIYAKDLSAKIMKMPEEERNECAMVIMQMMELQGALKTGLDGERVTIDDVQGFIDQGIPTIFNTLLTTEAGREILVQYGREFLAGYIEKNGIWGTSTMLTAGIMLTPSVLIFAESIYIGNKVALLYEDFTGYIGDKLEEAGNFISDSFNKAKDNFNSFTNWLTGKGNRSTSSDNNYFSLRKSSMADAGENLRDYARSLRIMAEDIRKIRCRSSINKNFAIARLASDLEEEADKMEKMHKTMDTIMQNYRTTEDRISNMLATNQD